MLPVDTELGLEGTSCRGFGVPEPRSKDQHVATRGSLTFQLPRNLSFNFRMGRSTICGILKDKGEAIWKVLMPQYVISSRVERGELAI